MTTTSTTEPTALDILRYARNLLITRGWTQGAFARDADDNGTHSYNEHANSFCSLGAIHRAVVDLSPKYYDEKELIEILKRSLTGPTMTIVSFNDSRPRNDDGKQQVIDLFDRAIALQKAIELTSIHRTEYADPLEDAIEDLRDPPSGTAMDLPPTTND